MKRLKQALAALLITAALTGFAFAETLDENGFYCNFTDHTRYLTDYSGTGGVVIIPPHYRIDAIEQMAFIGCVSITRLVIPYGVKTIGNFAFENCENMESIEIPESVLSVGEMAFEECYKLKSVTIPGQVTVLEEDLFDTCTSLTSVTLPQALETICDDAFSCCRSLEVLYIPKSVTYIGSGAFSNSNKLVLYGELNSCAEEYARLNNIPFSSEPYTKPAVPTASAVTLDDERVAFEAYNIEGSNYFKLRDLAMALNGTQKQFEIGWDAALNAIFTLRGDPYSPVGGELTGTGNTQTLDARFSAVRVFADDVLVSLTAYNIGGNNYFRLRDVARVLDFGVGWDGEANMVSIDTGSGYLG
jgi:hypothetical protein